MAKHTPESKEKISKKRKEWLKNNPDKHPWKRKDKFKSEPCENAKRFLKENGILFIEEFSPEIEGRFFSIDIALPDRMIAIEINGNQHYEKNGRLKLYYQERHDLLEKDGWTVFEVHYGACFNKDQWRSFSEKLKLKKVIKEFDYFNYKPRPKKGIHDKCPKCCGLKLRRSKTCKKCFSPIKKRTYNRNSGFSKKKRKNFNHECLCPLCLGQKYVKSKFCKSCYLKKPNKPVVLKEPKKMITNKRSGEFKIKWPNTEEMKKLVWEFPMSKLSKMLGVSDKSIKKHCEKRNIKTPPRGYFLRAEK